MTDTTFFARGPAFTLETLAELCEARLERGAGEGVRIDGIATLDAAGPGDVSFFDNPRYSADLAATRAGAIVVAPRHLGSVRSGLPVLVAKDAQRAFALAGRALFPDAISPMPLVGTSGVSDRASVDPSAVLEDCVVVEPFATIGPRAQVGRGTVVSSGAVIGADCRIGRDCCVGAQVSVQHALIGDRVILHSGVQIGQDGFGYSMGAAGILKMVQIGRVIVQDNVEIGANTTVDRGALRDTVIGENTKIDNQVQIAHNVRIGRNCVIVSQVGIAGSATLGDGVVIGGQSGVNGHVTIGDGAQIAAVSSVAGDVPPGARWGGAPAHPVRDWLREVMWVQEMAKRGRKSRKADE
ncbi:UDP-3-O-(3-hydroxymyristoyl)glucosamine N-acyltransferase [Aureimonas mangrovi]|uniref:UDP-3-O-(3-hydroxymyristoyl)glucosamine N-acyltransferase n=1 Tax=Aureimonas mangrovi TaxID=2758041 RepID=UPI00163D49C6|nr:UDP-3-O-(3-hydroxymyristoyl)glucosamine N-acyltransferase [Aureimonas mangrovi]